MDLYKKELSIQITLGGYSFCVDTPNGGRIASECQNYDFDEALSEYFQLNTIIEWSVPSVLIIPFEIFDHSAVNSYLKSASMLDNTKRAMFAVRGEHVAVWSVDAKLYDYVASRMPHIEHTHPLLRLLDMVVEVPSIIVEVDTSSVMNIVLRGIYGIESTYSVKINSAVDILFYAKQLLDARGITTQTIYLPEDTDQETITLLEGYYPNTITQ